MARSLPIRFAVSLLVCGLIGTGLAALAGGDQWERHTTVTTSVAVALHSR